MPFYELFIVGYLTTRSLADDPDGTVAKNSRRFYLVSDGWHEQDAGSHIFPLTAVPTTGIARLPSNSDDGYHEQIVTDDWEPTR